MPTSVSCPHCRTAVHCDPQLAGQIVSCPNCNGQFQMPVPRAVPVNPAPPPGNGGFPMISTGTRSSAGARSTPPKKSNPLPMILGGVAVAVVLLPCMCGLLGAIVNEGDGGQGNGNGGNGGGGAAVRSTGTSIGAKARSQIKHGMTKSQVRKILGEPDRRGDLDDGWEAWVYDRDSKVTIMFAAHGKCTMLEIDDDVLFDRISVAEPKASPPAAPVNQPPKTVAAPQKKASKKEPEVVELEDYDEGPYKVFHVVPVYSDGTGDLIKHGLQKTYWKVMYNRSAKRHLVSETTFVDGKRTGPYTKYDYETSEVVAKAEYKNDELHGQYITYRDYQGKLYPKLEGHYKDGKRDGLLTIWRHGERLACTITFKDGLRHGPFVKYENYDSPESPNTDRKQYEGQFANDKPSGKWRQFNWGYEYAGNKRKYVIKQTLEYDWDRKIGDRLEIAPDWTEWVGGLGP